MGSFHLPSKPSKYQCDLDEYFMLISQKIIKFKSLNKNSKQRRKNNIFQINYAMVNPEEETHYKENILLYCEDQYDKDRTWIEPLYRQIKSEDFIIEEKWLNLLFWQEFELRNKPPCLNKTQTKRLFYPQSDYFTYEIQNYSNKDALTYSYNTNQELVYTYVRIIKDHILNSEHPINFIYKAFTLHFTKYTKETLEKLINMKVHNQESFDLQCEGICKSVFEQLTKFINQLVKSIRLLYNKTFNFGIFTMENDEFINLMTSLIFEEGELSKYILQLISLNEESQINEFKALITSLSDISPDDAKVQDKFCLNDSSLSFYEINFKSKSLIKEDSNFHQQPYAETIELFKTIVLYKTPFDKILLIYKLSRNIRDCITKFWNGVDKNMPMKHLGIEANDLINIFAYIVVKAQMSDLVGQISFIKMFCPKKTLDSKFGMFLGYLETAMEYLNSVKENVKSVGTSLLREYEGFLDCFNKSSND